MSSRDALQGHQLRMFIPAGELKDLVHPPDVKQEQYYGNNRKQMWADKLAETKAIMPSDTELEQIASTATSVWDVVDAITHGAGLHEKIKASGVQTPVPLIYRDDEETDSRDLPTRPVLFEGHHRVAAAEDIDPKMEIPIEHMTMDDARETGRVK